MKDGPLRRAIKAPVLWINSLELALRRGLAWLRGERRWRLGGACGGCARCCEAPAIQVGRLTWYFPTLRRLFLGYQRVVNSFELTSSDRDARVFTFRCAHFDLETRRCDSYRSRPRMCRDHPRALLAQPWPELFPDCGFRQVAPDAARQLAALERAGLPPEQLEKLRRDLHLE
jgi:Fe-S-cluster containining protein